MITKLCTHCKIPKASTAFTRDSSRGDGLDYYCRDCKLQKERGRRAIQRERVIEALGGKCKWCDFSDHRALQVDHVMGGGRQERITINNPWRYYEQIIADKDERYQLLCANCNIIKRIENGEHGNAHL